jgi:hypothetical protein
MGGGQHPIEHRVGLLGAIGASPSLHVHNTGGGGGAGCQLGKLHRNHSERGGG